MAVLTIFNHGTGFNRVKGSEANELVGWMHGHVQGVEARINGGRPQAGNHIINEGPGSGTGGVALPTEVNPMTGRGRDDESVKFGKGGGKRSTFARGFAGQDGGGKSKLSGSISGAGWDENVQRTVQIIQTLKFENLYDVTTVNMVGWSRGAVTSIRIANKLFEVFGNTINCNIFGVDPVAGSNAGVEMQDTRRLPTSVSNYVAVLSMHERRNTFSPQDLSRMAVDDRASTNTCFLPMPGKHNEQVMGRSGVAASPESNITRNLAYAFLTHFGSRFDGLPAPAYISDQAMCQGYAKIRVASQAGSYKDSSGTFARIIGKGLGRRDFATSANMGGYVSGGKGSYWVNEHHRACFKSGFPGLYRTIFRGSARTDQFEPLGQSDLRSIGGPEGDIARSLVGMGYLFDTAGTLMVQHGAGRYVGRPQGNLWPQNLPRHA